jgi:hypothetical protein
MRVKDKEYTSTMNLGQYKDTKDMEKVMLTQMHLYSEISCSNLDDLLLKKRIKKISKLRKKLSNKRSIHFLCKKIKKLF